MSAPDFFRRKPVNSPLLQDPKFFQLLLQIDIDLAAQTRA
jgi:hypothetical protein